MDPISRALLMGGESGSPPGQILYEGPAAASGSTFSFVVPAGVASVSMVAVACGSPYAAGNLAYANNVAVTPGETLTVYVAGAGNPGNPPSGNPWSSYIKRGTTTLLQAFNRYNGASPGGTAASGGGAGGGSTGSGMAYGAGAGGYTGNGGLAGSAGSGGGGGGASTSRSNGGQTDYPFQYSWTGGLGGGGGVGLLGQGASGSVGVGAGGRGYGGSGGDSGGLGGTGSSSGGGTGGAGGKYGGAPGSGGALGFFDYDTGESDSLPAPNGSNGIGGVRIIWPGNTRFFPSTNTGDM